MLLHGQWGSIYTTTCILVSHAIRSRMSQGLLYGPLMNSSLMPNGIGDQISKDLGPSVSSFCTGTSLAVISYWALGLGSGMGGRNQDLFGKSKARTALSPEASVSSPPKQQLVNLLSNSCFSSKSHAFHFWQNNSGKMSFWKQFTQSSSLCLSFIHREQRLLPLYKSLEMQTHPARWNQHALTSTPTACQVFSHSGYASH